MTGWCFAAWCIVPGINLGEVDASSDDSNIAPACWMCAMASPAGSRRSRACPIPIRTIAPRSDPADRRQRQDAKHLSAGFRHRRCRIRRALSNQQRPRGLAGLRGQCARQDRYGHGAFRRQARCRRHRATGGAGVGILGLEGGFSMLKLTDPAVLFASVNYVYTRCPRTSTRPSAMSLSAGSIRAIPSTPIWASASRSTRTSPSRWDTSTAMSAPIHNAGDHAADPTRCRSAP